VPATPAPFAGPLSEVSAWRVHDIAFLIRRDRRLSIDVLQPFLSALPLAVDAAPPSIPDFTLDVTAGPEPMPELPATSGSTVSFGFRIQATHDVIVVTDGDSWVKTDLSKGRARLSIHPSFIDQPVRQRLSLFLIGLNELLGTRGRFDLHGAALVRPGKAILLIGPSRSGKSTAALSLVANGWNYVSDDALLLVDAAPVQARSFRRAFNVDAELVDRFPEIADHFEGETGDDGKRFLNIDQAFPGRFIESCVPTQIVFTQVSGERETTVRALPAVVALTRLIEQSASLAFRTRHARRQLETLKRLVDQAPAFLLSAGRDARERPEVLHRRLAALQ
jgi:hypothetical protein